jgi:hypothetical protein
MQEAQESPPNRPGVTGTTLVHYGPIWDRSLDATQESKERPVAVLVCHGMGQQARYETISAVAQCILAEAKTQGGTVTPVEVHLTEANGEFLARAEINWTDKSNDKHQVHVYEAYWAPLYGSQDHLLGHRQISPQSRLEWPKAQPTFFPWPLSTVGVWWPEDDDHRAVRLVCHPLCVVISHASGGDHWVCRPRTDPSNTRMCWHSPSLRSRALDICTHGSTGCPPYSPE